MTRSFTIFALLLALPACKPDSSEQQRAAEQAAPKPADAPIPTTEAEFLAELIPLPDRAEAIEITYAVTGPALEGELTVLLGPGGQKREQWELRTTGADLRSAGSAVVNTTQIWHGADGQPGELRPNHLGALAQAWAALDESKRAAVVTAIRDWHELLEKRRAEVPGDQTKILGVSCLQTRIAAQNLCMWEQVGVFLRYEGSAFNIEATQIDRAAKLPPDAFALPPQASAATLIEVPPIDFAAALDQAAEGNFAELFLLVSQTRALPKLERPPAPEAAGETG